MLLTECPKKRERGGGLLMKCSMNQDFRWSKCRRLRFGFEILKFVAVASGIKFLSFWCEFKTLIIYALHNGKLTQFW